jgi:ferredoxin
VVIRLRVTADNTKCVVSCMCVYRAPTVFDQDEDGLVVVLDSAPPAELAQDVLSAAQGCPVGAISVHQEPEPEQPRVPDGRVGGAGG